jgi:hypothetical protein
MNVYNGLLLPRKFWTILTMMKAGLITWADWNNTARKKRSEDRTMRIINAFSGISDSTTKEELNVAIWHLY